MDPDGYIRFRCNVCGKRMRVKVQQSSGGQLMHCPRCGSIMTLPIFKTEGSLQEEIQERRQDKGLAEGFGDEQAIESTLRRIEEFARQQTPTEQPQPHDTTGDRPKWRPTLGLRKVTESTEEIEDFRRRVQQIEQDIYERALSVFKDAEATQERMEAVVERIAQDRRKHLELTYAKTRDSLLDEIRTLMPAEGKPSPDDLRRILQLRNAMSRIDLYATRILGIR